MATPESRVIEQIKKVVKSHGGKVVKIHQSGFSEIGIPDLMVFLPEDYFHYPQTALVEVKTKGKKPTKIQLRKIDEINKAGGHAFWTDNLDDFKSEMNIFD